MKLSFQLCNVEHPNSCKNSCVFAVFEAPDTTANLNIALETFRSQINDLCGKELWRYNSQSMHISHLIIHNITTGGRRQGCFFVETMHFSPLCMVSQGHQVLHIHIHDCE